MSDSLHDFDRRPMSFDAQSLDVYVAGSGPAVVVLHEMPGLTPDVAGCCRRIVDAGFTVWAPSLFGEPGREFSNRYLASSMSRGCVNRSFLAFARAKRTPMVDWVSQLVTHAHEHSGGSGVGVVGMCFTGNFALALAVDPAVLVPVMSQPSLPLALSKKHKSDLHVSPDDLEVVKARARDEDLCVIGLRFTADPLMPAERFERLRQEFGEAFIGVEIESGDDNEWGHDKKAHSVLTTEYSDDPESPTYRAFELMLDHFRQKLTI